MKVNKTIIKYAAIAAIYFCSTVNGQMNITRELLTVKDGLSNNQIRDIVQDKYGYMWFSTADGVNMYDGYKITVFKNIPGDTTSLPANVTFNVYEDKEGTLWIGTDAGLARFNRNSKTFTNYKFTELNEPTSNRVINFCEDIHEKLWVATILGTYEFDRNKNEFISYDIMRIDNSIVEYLSYGGIINADSNGELYNICSTYGLLKFDYDAGLFVQLDLKENINKKFNDGIYFSMEFDKDNNVWLAISKGLFKYDVLENRVYDLTPFKKRPEINEFLDNAARGLFRDNNNMWVGTGLHGVYLFDLETNEVEQIIKPASAVAFQGFYEDNSGLLWFGSSRGVSKIDFNRKPFESYTFENDSEESPDNRVFSFIQTLSNKENILLGTPVGIKIFNSENKISSINDSKYKSLSKLNSMRIADIVESSNNILWIATDDNGLWSYNKVSENMKNYLSKNYDNSSLRNDKIRDLSMDVSENIWIGTNGGLQILNVKEDSFINVPSLLNRNYNSELITFMQKLREETKSISSILEVGDFADLTKEFVVRKDVKAFIYSTGEGLPRFNMVDFGWLESENGDTLWSAGEFHETFHSSGDFKNRIKIGTLELKTGRYKLRYKSDESHSAQGYNRFPPHDSTYWGAQIFELTDEDFMQTSDLLKESNETTYLTGEDITCVFKDSQNYMWVGSNDGVSRIDTSLNVENYINIPSDKNSLSSNNVRAINEDSSGNIWIATRNGLNKFNRSQKTFLQIWERDGLPSANLSSIEVDKQGNLWVSGLKGISKIELNKNDDKFIIVNYDVKDGLQGYEYLNRSSFIDNSGRLYFGGRDGFNVFYPGSSNRTPPSLVIQDIKLSNISIGDIDKFGEPDLNKLSEVELSHNQNDISFEFASIHFSRPDKNRILYKMDGVDGDWVNGERRYAAYTNLSPGDYTFNVRGSNGDGVWSEETKQIKFHIAAPWYNNWAAYSVYALVFFGLLFSVRKFEISRQKKNMQLKESRLQIEAAKLEVKAAETERKLLEAENKRKSQELEEARELQLSMLPRELPALPNLDIAVYMKTATEVGGDYYDFHVGLDGTLTVVLGDATGHGMKAGTMVTSVKSLFNVLAPNPDIVVTFHEITRCIKLMQMEKLSMCMTMLKIKGDTLQMSAAGMPPTFIYKHNIKTIEEHVFKGMPLGTMDNFPYDNRETKLEPGDTILVMSDGFPELQNKDNEQYGYKKTRNKFEEVAEGTPEQIIDILKNEGSDWVDGVEPDDDVTFVVIKVK